MAAQQIRDARRIGIRLRSFDELPFDIWDPRPYVNEQRQRLLTSDDEYPDGLYVDKRFRNLGGGTDHHNARDAVMDWLGTPSNQFVLLLGEFGTGKTYLLHELARRIPTVMPILVEMRSLEKGRSLRELVGQHVTRHGHPFHPETFDYLLREGRVVLLFDGFDELRLRSTYDRAAEHLSTVIEAASGKGKVVVSSRTQHFYRDEQVLTALGQQVASIPGRRVIALQRLNEAEKRALLVRTFRDDEARADRYLSLLGDVHDLLGVSENARMLSFIVELLSEDDLRAAAQGGGTISAGNLYARLLEKWFEHEIARVQPTGRGDLPTMDRNDRWLAVTVLARRLWFFGEDGVVFEDLVEIAKLPGLLDRLAERVLTGAEAGHIIGSGTLLVRTEDGRFSFVHQSVMEWLIANDAVERLRSGDVAGVSELFERRAMTELLCEFFVDLAGVDQARAWVENPAERSSGELATTKARVLRRLGDDRARAGIGSDLRGANLAGADLRRRDLAGVSAAVAQLSGALLDEADLRGADLSGADLSGASLVRADLRGARLDGADLTSARLLGADIMGAVVDGARTARVALLGVEIDPAQTELDEAFGAARPGIPARPQVAPPSSASLAVAVVGAGNLVVCGDQSGLIRFWEGSTGKPLRSFEGHAGRVRALAVSPQGDRLYSGGEDGAVRSWDTATGQARGRFEGHARGVFALAISPQGDRLYSGGGDGAVRSWDTATGQALGSFEGHGRGVWALAGSPQGGRLCSGGEDGAVRSWDTATGQALGSFEGHPGGVFALAVSPQGDRLYSGGGDTTVRSWDTATNTPIAALVALADDGYAVLLPDGSYKLEGDPGGLLWWMCGLHRFEPGEIDEWAPSVRRVPAAALLPA